MSVRYAISGLLARHPSTGYELTQTFDRSLRTSWHASHSQIYPELGKLESAGLAEVVGRGARRSKTHGLTTYGRTSCVAGWSRPSPTGPNAARAACAPSSHHQEPVGAAHKALIS